MRITGGQFGGRKIVAPKGTDTRPTTDRVKEAAFNALQGIADLEDATVVDLFAGSGALGLEAISRGAKSVTFVDQGAPAVEAIIDNLTSLNIDGMRIEKKDVHQFLLRAAEFDFAFVDPPFALDDSNWVRILNSLKAEIVVAESNRDISELFEPRFEVIRYKAYGDSHLVIAKSRVQLL